MSNSHHPLPSPQSRIVPKFIERTPQGERQWDPYTKLFDERIIFLGIPIYDEVANDVMAELLTLESLDPDRDISLYINSPGGSFSAMTAIYDTMQFVKPEIQTICMGQAASAAAVLLASGTKGKRFALANSRILIHQPSSEGGGGAPRRGQPGQALRAPARAHPHPPALHRGRWPGHRHRDPGQRAAPDA